MPMICIPNTCNDLHLIISTFPCKAIPSSWIRWLRKGQQGTGICTWEPAFAVKIHLSYLSPDRLCCNQHSDVGMGHLFDPQFPMLARFSVIPGQLRQSNSPNIIQSGFTCDASSSIYCCNWDVRTVWVPTGWLTEPTRER
jgi:hypothetical protein